ncbi:MAG: 2-phosphosulfolactate phosphatase family protein [Microcystis sp. M54BS1]|uniref:Probable 2-phosphosulfolactate phosphatase n=1 Tax=Microcystis aeruginosa Sj TaxID=1979544 RepID=A0A2Z6UND0_MICAE|nr:MULTISPECIES: 2-phosphosulfolactate phosphatase family protein [Microcystis]MCA2540224.1 2-phosphosulfolactate phosphatase family protein [Microcystis sp. M54BS1]MCA2595351.1 2-phosphosulfolactate phosphatase family protein [Microcystis sp. M38BS1]MCA2609863.1 2-phosphosulfolactate phosphatase family protein [Microcystis sp. M27BS1]MCA2504592.1 2-phosphosulfolactate phosphatase family protein [Microcystis sp. M62BS1]MCA2510398.1 2-phosphosulfolactate phosphatase family protein [Microcystis 
MQVFIYHTPELTPVHTLPDCAVVIDVLRATTTIATALNAGAEAVQTFSDLKTLMQVSDTWQPAKRLRAGERGGAKVEGCDLGNSPLDCTPDLMKGRRLFISTTNGTRALQRVEESPIVITAAMINRQAAVNYLLDRQPDTVWIVGSGWEGGYSLEDTACAGAIANALQEQSGQMAIGNDEVIASIALYRQWQNDLLGMFHSCSHGQRLLRLHCQEDLKYCANIDSLDVLPIQKEPSILVKL